MNTRFERARQRGFTIVEILCAAAILSSLLGAIFGLVRGAGRGAEQTGAVTDAVQSVLIASECLRQDLSRILFEKPARDLAVAHRSIGFRVPDGLGTDPWTLNYHPVHYESRPSGGQQGVFQLYRTEAGRTLPVPSSYFREVRFGYRRPADRPHPYLEVYLIGCDAHGQGSYPATFLLPLPFTVPPPPVELKGAS